MNYSRPRRQCSASPLRRNPPRWRYADDWRDAFTRGAIDALRCASRESDDPAVWMLLDRIAEQYSDPDKYGLAR